MHKESLRRCLPHDDDDDFLFRKAYIRFTVRNKHRLTYNPSDAPPPGLVADAASAVQAVYLKLNKIAEAGPGFLETPISLD